MDPFNGYNEVDGILGEGLGMYLMIQSCLTFRELSTVEDCLIEYINKYEKELNSNQIAYLRDCLASKHKELTDIYVAQLN